MVIPEKFQHILRIMNTNIDGKIKIMFALTAIKGIGRRFSNVVLKKADVDLDKRAGECSEEEVSSFRYQLVNYFHEGGLFIMIYLYLFPKLNCHFMCKIKTSIETNFIPPKCLITNCVSQ